MLPCLIAAPAPYYAQNNVATKCIDPDKDGSNNGRFFSPFGPSDEIICNSTKDIADPRLGEEGITAAQVEEISMFTSHIFQKKHHLVLYVTTVVDSEHTKDH